jgi:hypothetical protein
VKKIMLLAVLALGSSWAHASTVDADAEPAPFDFWAWMASLFCADTETNARYLIKSDGVIYD